MKDYGIDRHEAAICQLLAKDLTKAEQEKLLADVALGSDSINSKVQQLVRAKIRDKELSAIKEQGAKPLEGILNVFVIDPPWPIGVNLDPRVALAPNYPTMLVPKIEEQVGAILKKHLAENAQVFLWTTEGFLHKAFHLLEAWQLQYACTFTWVKR